MNKISHFTLAALLVVSLAQLPAADQKTSAVDSLEQGFLVPPESAKPKTWWHWMSGCVTGAMHAYQAMLYGEEGVNANIKENWKRLLLQYCELDTMAMVIIFEHWRSNSPG